MIFARYGYPSALAAATVLAALLVTGLPVRALRGARRPLLVTLTCPRHTVTRGETVPVRVASTGRAEIRLRVTGLPAVTVRAGDVWESPPLPRGLVTVTVESVADVGALALWRWRLPYEATTLTVRVRPRRVALRPPPESVSDTDDGRPAPIGAGTGAVFAGLREYEAGDDIRHIDWAASARAADDDVLYVRQFGPSLADGLLIVLDPAAGPAFETAVDLAYSLAAAGGHLAVLGRAGVRHGPGDAEELLIVLRPDPAPPLAAGLPGAPVVVTADVTRAAPLRGTARLVLAVGSGEPATERPGVPAGAGQPAVSWPGVRTTGGPVVADRPGFRAAGGPVVPDRPGVRAAGGPVVPVADLDEARVVWDRWAAR
ncbi:MULTISPECIES: DUF58 domain-containing protein [Catenuloplanes]|uniref:DUF58 domain-containing protein n=1 Tax=Catenuloplanes niger TaxID=587534 RepID=A0AAE4CWM6_9ACTN|nr:DUF58 domain-containing protein [Catenuloplanes niger]MDR7327370.1 hypothetical protein [Catenuloplanes niger]